MNKITTPNFPSSPIKFMSFLQVNIDKSVLHTLNSLTEKLDFNSKVVFLAGLIFACFC